MKTLSLKEFVEVYEQRYSGARLVSGNFEKEYAEALRGLEENQNLLEQMLD